MSRMTEGQYELGDFALQNGQILKDAFIGYATYGDLNDAADNVIVFPTWYTGTHHGVDPYVGEGKALDPSLYFIVVPDMFTNGYSTSPSNAIGPANGIEFPLVTPFDNVAAQRRLLLEHFGITSIELMVGFSMSGQQAYHWGALHSDIVRRICSICGTARTSPHNWAMLHAYKSAMEASADWGAQGHKSWTPEVMTVVSSIGATMAMSQDWYRAGLHLTEEVSCVADVITNLSQLFDRWVPADLYAQTLTWMSADVSANETFNGDLESALRAIEVPALLMPCDTDMYFRVEDNEAELSLMPNAVMKVIHSKWGHMAGMPGANPDDDRFVDRALASFLEER